MTEPGNIPIGAFPEDDRKYIVKRYGKIRKNPSPTSSSSFLVQVTLEDLETGKEQICEILLPYLLLARIGSVWLNRRRVEKRLIREGPSFISFEDRSFVLGCGREYGFEYYVQKRKTGERFTVSDISSLDLNTHDLLSVFTVLNAEDGSSVAIPSLELFVLTYVPRTYGILYDLLSLPIDSVLEKYVKSHSINNEDGKRSYSIQPYGNHFLSTRIFLAYLACDKETRENVSLIKADLERNRADRNDPYSYSFSGVRPYHPRCLSIKASGYYNEDRNRYWVQQINGYAPPDDAFFEYIEDEKGDQGDPGNQKREKDSSKVKANREEITEDLDLINDTDAGWGAGQKYIRSDIDIVFNDEKIINVSVSGKGRKSEYRTVKKEKAEALSASPLSGRKDSENVGSVSFSGKSDKSEEETGETKSKTEVLLEALGDIRNEKYYLDDACHRKTDPVYCTLRNEDCNGENKRENGWAKKSGEKARRLLVCEIAREGDWLYLMDIERKKTEAYSCIAFALDTPMDQDTLERIKRCVSEHRGRPYGKRGNSDASKNKSKEKGKPKTEKASELFPIEERITFRHSRDRQTMTKRIQSLIDTYKINEEKS